MTVGMPTGEIWAGVQSDVGDVLHASIDELGAAGWRTRRVEGGLLDEARALYMGGSIVSAECRTFLGAELPDWLETLDSTVKSS